MAKWSTFGVRLVIVIAILCVVTSLDLRGWQRWVVLIASLVLACICMRYQIPASLRYVGVALLFAICGTMSATHLLSSGWEPTQVHMMFAVPFALLCAVLFLRTGRIILAAPLMIAVWVAACVAATWTGMARAQDVFSPVYVGGIVGGLGLVLCASICYWRLILPKYLFGGAVIGAVSALPFAPWLRLYTSHLNSPPPTPPLLAFAIWQAAVGTYLYAICTEASEKKWPAESTTAI